MFKSINIYIQNISVLIRIYSSNQFDALYAKIGSGQNQIKIFLNSYKASENNKTIKTDYLNKQCF